MLSVLGSTNHVLMIRDKAKHWIHCLEEYYVMQRLDSYSSNYSYIGVGAHALHSSPQHSNSLTVRAVVSQGENGANVQRLLQKWDFVCKACARRLVCPAASVKMQMALLRITGYLCVAEAPPHLKQVKCSVRFCVLQVHSSLTVG